MTKASKISSVYYWATSLSLFVIISLMLSACGDVTQAPITAVTPLPATAVQYTTRPRTTSVPTATHQTVMPTANGITTPTISRVFPELAKLPAIATNLSIYDDYTDMGSARSKHYILAKQPEGFTGKGIFRIVPWFNTSSESYGMTTIKIPADISQTFLQTITQLPIAEGIYTPTINYTDSYPSIGYQVDTTVGTLRLYTGSQNKDFNNSDLGNNLPWGFSFNQRTFVITSPLVAQALTQLKPYLQEALGDNPSQSTLTAPAATATPVPVAATSGPLTLFEPQLASLQDATTLDLAYWERTDSGIYQADYFLIHNANQYEGEGQFQDNLAFKTISVPDSVIHEFWQNILHAPLTKTSKEPDDFDSSLMISNFLYTLIIEPLTQNATTVYINYGGQYFTVPANVIFPMLDKLWPYLDKDIIKNYPPIDH